MTREETAGPLYYDRCHRNRLFSRQFRTACQFRSSVAYVVFWSAMLLLVRCDLCERTLDCPHAAPAQSTSRLFIVRQPNTQTHKTLMSTELQPNPPNSQSLQARTASCICRSGGGTRASLHAQQSLLSPSEPLPHYEINVTTVVCSNDHPSRGLYRRSNPGGMPDYISLDGSGDN